MSIVAPRLLFLVTAVALALRLFGVWFGWPHVFHPDEARVVARAARLLQVGDPNPHFFTYPTLYLYSLSLVLAPISLLTSYADQPALFHLAARCVNAVIGTVTVPLVYLLAYRVSGRTAAMVAAAALAVNPLHVEESHFATTDVPATLLFTAGLWHTVAAYESGTLRQYFLAGATAGFAMSTKYPAGLVFLAVPVAAALGRVQVKRLVVAALAFAVAFFVGTPFAAFDPRAFLDDMVTEWIATRSGFLGATHPDALYYVQRLGPVMMGAALLGAIALALKRPRQCLVLLAGTLPLALLMSGALIKLDRYVLPVVPVLCLFMGCFVAWMLESVPGRMRVLAGVGVTALMLAAPAREAAACVVGQAAPDQRMEAAHWMAANLTGGPIVWLPPHEWMGPPIHTLGGRLPHSYDDRVRERIVWEERVLADRATKPLVAQALAYRVHTPEMAERRLKTLPGIEDVPQGTFPRGVQYVVMSNAFKELYQDPDTAAAYPKSTEFWRRVFGEVERGVLVKEWAGSAGCESFLRAPTLKLYRIEVK